MLQIESIKAPYFTYCTELFSPPEHLRQELIGLRHINEVFLREGNFTAANLAQKQIARIPMVKQWDDNSINLVTTTGKNDLLDKYFAGSGYTAGWFLGLIENAGFSAINAADTSASHAGWTENTVYSSATRPAIAFAAASGGSKSSSSAVSFAINGSSAVNGVFTISNSTKSGTTGILYSASSFAVPRTGMISGDTLAVNMTVNAT